MRYYLSIPLPKPLSDQVQDAEQKWQGTSRSDPHLTIIVPREAEPDLDEAKMVRAIAAALAPIRPFMVILGEVGYFGDHATIYLGVARSSQLVQCHTLLDEAVRPFLVDGQGAFDHLPNPHITLATHLEGETATLAWQDLLGRKFSGSFTCDEINLMRKDHHEPHWEVIQKFTL